MPGREYDSETGLYYYRARYYNPTQGRFLSRDPLGYLPDVNLYRYVGNNPLNLTDPNGQNPILVAIGLGALFGAAVGWQNAFFAAHGQLSFRQGLAAAGVGAIAGMGITVAGTGASILVVAGWAGGFSALGSLAYQSLAGTDIANLNLTSAGIAFLVGAAGGLFSASVWLPYETGTVSPALQALTSKLAAAGGITSPWGALGSVLSPLLRLTPQDLFGIFGPTRGSSDPKKRRRTQ